MSLRYLGILDLAGIQDYIAAAGTLKEIAAASRFVEDLSLDKGLFASCGPECGVELIVAAGGVALYRCADRGPMQSTFRAVSKHLVMSRTGLEVVGAIEPYSEGKLAQSYQSIHFALEKKKCSQPRSARSKFPGMTPTRAAYPDQPAIIGPFVQPRDLDDVLGNGYWIDGNQKNRPEQTGLLAVVSVDGIGMGRKMRSWLGSVDERDLSDGEFVTELRAWSSSVRRRWTQAWAECIEELDTFFTSSDFALRHPGNSARYLAARPAYGSHGKHEPDRHYRMVRRIYQGGDDLSFVCDARIALSFTARLVAKLEREADAPIHDAFHRLTCSVGIVFTDSHYPFSRTRILADFVVRPAAKAHAVKLNQNNPPSCLDWWVNRGGSHERGPKAFSVIPCAFAPSDSPHSLACWRYLEDSLYGMWQVFEPSGSVIGKLGGAGVASVDAPADSKGKRNKLKDLMLAASSGPEAVGSLLKSRPLAAGRTHELVKRFILPDHSPETCFNTEGTRTGILDAGELYDIHFPLPWPDSETTKHAQEDAI